jgi:hypothetical protein
MKIILSLNPAAILHFNGVLAVKDSEIAFILKVNTVAA